MSDVREIYDDKVMSTQALYNANSDVWNNWILNNNNNEKRNQSDLFCFLDKVVCVYRK